MEKWFENEILNINKLDNIKASLSKEIKEKNGNPIKNWGDITKIIPEELPNFDLFTGGFPCQPFSTVGKQ